jgi:hypothetical protein
MALFRLSSAKDKTKAAFECNGLYKEITFIPFSSSVLEGEYLDNSHLRFELKSRYQKYLVLPLN